MGAEHPEDKLAAEAASMATLFSGFLTRFEERHRNPRPRPPAAVPKALPVLNAASNPRRQLTSVPNRLMGYALRETTGQAAATAVLSIRDGADGEDGELIVPVNFDAGETVRDWFGDAGLEIAVGVVVVVTLGSVDGVVYLAEV
jgi:hypothetical protein